MHNRKAASFTGLLLVSTALGTALASTAHADTVAPAVDVSGTANTFIDFIFAGLSATALALLHRGTAALKNMHILQDNSALNSSLDAAIRQGVTWATAQLEAIVDPAARIQAHGAISAQAAELVRDLVPRAIAAADVDTSTIQTRIRMALGDPALGVPGVPARPAASVEEIMSRMEAELTAYATAKLAALPVADIKPIGGAMAAAVAPTAAAPAEADGTEDTTARKAPLVPAAGLGVVLALCGLVGCAALTTAVVANGPALIQAGITLAEAVAAHNTTVENAINAGATFCAKTVAGPVGEAAQTVVLAAADASGVPLSVTHAAAADVGATCAALSATPTPAPGQVGALLPASAAPTVPVATVSGSALATVTAPLPELPVPPIPPAAASPVTATPAGT